jgi:hypothetical protein
MTDTDFAGVDLSSFFCSRFRSLGSVFLFIFYGKIISEYNACLTSE